MSSAYARPQNRLHYLKCSSFSRSETQQHCDLNLIDPLESVKVGGAFQFPGVRHKQTRERWSLQRYWFPTTAALTGSTQKFLQTHRVGSDGGAVQLDLLWLHERAQLTRAVWPGAGIVTKAMWDLEKHGRDINHHGAKHIHTCALMSWCVILIKTEARLQVDLLWLRVKPGSFISVHIRLRKRFDADDAFRFRNCQ